MYRDYIVLNETWWDGF